MPAGGRPARTRGARQPLRLHPATMLDQDPGRGRCASTIPASPATSRRRSPTSPATRTCSSPTTSPTSGRPQPLDQPVRRPPPRHRRASRTTRSWPMSATDNFHDATAQPRAGGTAERRFRPSGTSTATASGRAIVPDVWFDFDAEGFDRDPHGRRDRLARLRLQTAARRLLADQRLGRRRGDPPAGSVPRARRRHAGRRCLRPQPRDPGEPDHPGRRGHPAHRRGAAGCGSRPRRKLGHCNPGRVRLRPAQRHRR